MEISLIILSAIIATSAMTAFSYLYGYLQAKQFREPVLLNKLIKELPFHDIKISENSMAGWVIHYLVGLFFVLVFNWIWNTTRLDPDWFTGLSFGFAAGIIGVLVWMLTFRIHPDPPKINFREYYFQLIIAHMVFGISSILVYNWVEYQ